MANYKRRYPRAKGSPHKSAVTWRAENGCKPVDYRASGLRAWEVEWHPYKSMLNSWPRSHDILLHTRPSRRAWRRVERQILRGIDHDDMVFPLDKKPHKYYW